MTARKTISPPVAGPEKVHAGTYTGLVGKYLRLEELRWLRNLQFASRRAVEGQYAGRHSSSQRGHSVEFCDYRQYSQGDEPGDIDWKVFGRSDRLYVKLFEQQSDMTVHIVVDASASMAYAGLGGQGDSKFDHACRMVAAIAFLTTKQQDRASLALAQDAGPSFIRPRGSLRHFCDILRAMEAVKPVGKANLSDVLRQVATSTGRRGLVVLFSDLLDDPRNILDSLSIFTHRGGEVIVFHVLHADELKLPDLQDTVFIDSESGGRIRLNVHDMRKAYKRRMDRFLRVCSGGCRGRGIDYNLVPTSRDYADALSEYLLRRSSTG